MDSLTVLKQLREQLPPDVPANVDVREEMLAEARRLLLDLERPQNTVNRVGLQLVESVVIDIAVRMGLFKALNGSPAGTVVDLAQKCKADPTLTRRLLRCLAANGAVQENGSDSYSPNSISRLFTERKNEVTVISYIELLAHGWLALPKYLEERRWQNPSSQTDTAIGKGWNMTDRTLWEVLVASPFQGEVMEYMVSFNEDHKEWFDFYPVVERLASETDISDPTAVMMVDVGGGLGHQAINAKRRFPELSGRFIVQDLAQAFPPSSQRPNDVEYMEHDFTKEQPVRGARLYYLRYIPHDWPQDFNVNLFAQLRKAMDPGYSKLIVNEWIFPDVGPSVFMTAMDVHMMAVSGGMERSEAQHRDYLEKAGLKITGIFYPGDKISEAVIEAEVA